MTKRTEKKEEGNGASDSPGLLDWVCAPMNKKIKNEKMLKLLTL